MRVKSTAARRSSALAAVVSTALAVGLGTTTVPMASAAPHKTTFTNEPGAAKSRTIQDKAAYDAREGARASVQDSLDRHAATASSRRVTEGLRAKLGLQAVVEMDGLTGTPRQVARLDGFLTSRSSLPAKTVAMSYVRTHLAALGMKQSDLASFTLRRNYVDIAGIHHLSWTQSAGGIEVFGNGLQANVTSDGRLISLGGSPISGLAAPRALPSKISSASTAISAARADVGEVRIAGPDDTASQVLFMTPSGTRRAWQTVTMSASRPMLTVVDASTGQVLFRQDLSDDANGQSTAATGAVAAKSRSKPAHSTGLAHLYFPKHRPRGGKALRVDYTKRGWLSTKAKLLSGNNSHAYSDVNDDDKPNRSEEVHAKTPHSWAYRLKPFHLKHVSFCDNPYPCSWRPNKAYSWRTNRAQNASQVFFFVNNWHDYLKRSPIGFTEAAGNFQRVNASGKGKGGDPVRTETDDGANTDHGLPDSNHIDNANMSTPPDGRAPRMQMYLQHQPFTSYPNGDPFAPTNVGDEADTVYHEYTHGLSNRLVVDAGGRSTLGPVQAGAMGEAWSDWYAMDYLVTKRLEADKKASGDVVLFQYDGAGVALDRTEPIDCAVGAKTRRCPGGATGHRGGYTYKDYGDVIGGPEVHADGEIWAQTLWDLRYRLGSRLSESLVTRAMELSPANPSFLDERNAILLADQAIYGGHHQAKIWRVFARRGMGYFAGSLGGNDTSPGASFRVPPKGNNVGSIVGLVTDRETGAPIKGAVVSVAFQGSPFVVNPSTKTDANGRFSIGPLPRGRYPKVTISSTGYDAVRRSVKVDTRMTRLNPKLKRDWASSAGGAAIDRFTGPDFGRPCGPGNALDQSDSGGWVTLDDLVNGQVGPKTPKNIVIALPQTIDVTEITVNPTSVCGLGLSASTGSYRVATSPDGSQGSWTVVHDGTFAFADLGHANDVPLDAGQAGVQYVRFTIKAPLVLVDTGSYGPDACNSGGAFSGCDFEAVTEVEVYGTAAP